MKPLPTLRQLRYLVALADHLHFGRAAEACLATQSTLSAGLRELEAVLGVTLVERTRRRVLLTPPGHQVVARARRLLADAEELTELARAAAQPLSGPLRLGVIPTIGPYLLPRVLPALRAAHPALRLYLREDLSAPLLARLLAGDLDLLMLALPYPADGIETGVLFDDPFVLACRPGHKLAEGDTVSGADLAGAELLLLEEGHCLREHALAACRLSAWRGSGGREDVSATSLTTLVQMVAGGLGVTLLPWLAVEAGMLTGTGLVTRPLAGDAPPRAIGLVWRTSSPRRRDYLLLGDEIRRSLGR